MGGKREYPDHPVVGVGGVVILDGRALLIRRGSEPLKGQWSVPGGTLELGETLLGSLIWAMFHSVGILPPICPSGGPVRSVPRKCGVE